MKEAVIAVIRHADGKRLLAVSRRHDHTAMGLPGGKVEPGEALDAAIVREVMEETGLVFTDHKQVYDDVRPTNTRVFAYTGIGTGEIKSSDEGITRWVNPDEILAGPFGKYNERLFKLLGIE